MTSAGQPRLSWTASNWGERNPDSAGQNTTTQKAGATEFRTEALTKCVSDSIGSTVTEGKRKRCE